MDESMIDGPAAAWPRVGCVWLPQLPLRAEILRHPAWDGRPVVMGGGPGERKLVQMCSPEAERAGIRPGLPLQEVLPLSQAAIILQPDPVRTASVLEDVLLRLQRITPAVELMSDVFQQRRPGLRSAGLERLLEGKFFLDLAGVGQVYRNNVAALERGIRAVVPPLLQPRIGLASGKFIASVAAQSAPPRGLRMVPAEDGISFLAPLSVHYLPFEPQVQRRLDFLGIATIGELAALPFSAVQAQFGRAGAWAWRLANSQDGEPILAQPHNPTVLAALRCDDALSSVEAVLAALDQLLARAFANPSMRGRSARQLRLRALLVDGSSWERLFTLKEALSDRQSVRRALRSKLAAANMLPSSPIGELSLELLGLGPETARQMPLFGNRFRQQRQIAEAARQLTARYGHTPLFRAVEVEPWSRIPERRWALTPYEP